MLKKEGKKAKKKELMHDTHQAKFQHSVIASLKDPSFSSLCANHESHLYISATNTQVYNQQSILTNEVNKKFIPPVFYDQVRDVYVYIAPILQ